MATPQGPSVPPPGVTVSCPHCGVALQIPASQAGAICACPVCQGKFQAPVPSALPAGVGMGWGPPLPPHVKDFVSKKTAAGVCGILLGALGIHKFILGLTSAGVIMLLVSLVGGVCTLGISTLVMSVIGLVEGIIYLSKSDEDFYQTYAVQKKQWF
ncbi:NINE protein [Thermogutta sp.]|uniref:TM2 domain-containing protein n=1 Tax=Thermogutta sp. TaxID=1962930 RepID=UPI00321F7E7C